MPHDWRDGSLGFLNRLGRIGGVEPVSWAAGHDRFDQVGLHSLSDAVVQSLERLGHLLHHVRYAFGIVCGDNRTRQALAGLKTLAAELDLPRAVPQTFLQVLRRENQMPGQVGYRRRYGVLPGGCFGIYGIPRK